MTKMANNLKQLRESISISQDVLCDISGVSKKTIGRFERGKTSPNPKTVERIAKALGVKPRALFQTLDHRDEADSKLREMGYQPLRTYLDGETALAFQMVEHLYGIPVRSQFLMAPLFSVLLAEGSLSWRREQLSKIDDAAQALLDLGEGHLSFAHDVGGVKEGAFQERQSIEKRDIFARILDNEEFNENFDPNERNPFADYLEAFIKKLNAKDIALTDRSGIRDWKTQEGLPEYSIATEFIENLTGGNAWAEFALVRGFARIRDIPKNLLGDDATKTRIEWLESKIPAEERARREKWLKSFGDIDLDELLPKSADADTEED